MDATVVKIGGSLTSHPQKLRTLCKRLSEASKVHKVIVVPGGGEFADAVRNLDKRFNLSRNVSHRMAILGMDQYGLMLSDLMPNSHVVNKLEDAQSVLNLGKLSIFLPSTFMFSNDPLENSWDVTSDSIAVYVAGQLQISKAVLLTDVNGIYTCDPKKFPEAKLISTLSAEELLKMNKRTSVDVFLPKLLLQLPIECFVVNGLYPDRVEAVIDGQEVPCTIINHESRKLLR